MLRLDRGDSVCTPDTVTAVIHRGREVRTPITTAASASQLCFQSIARRAVGFQTEGVTATPKGELRPDAISVRVHRVHFRRMGRS